MSPTGFRVIHEQRRAKTNYRFAMMNVVLTLIQIFNFANTVILKNQWYGVIFLANIALHVWFYKRHIGVAKECQQRVRDQLEQYATRRRE